MSVRFQNKNKIPSKYILLFMTMICLVMIGLSYAFEGVFTPLRFVTGVTVTPMQRGINSIGLWVTDRVDMIAEIKSLEEENARLKQELADYQTANRIALSNESELNDLRNLYELDARYPSYEKVAANVISKNSGSWFDTFTIDKGSGDGIREGANVIVDNGLVGIVTEVGPNYAKVRSIIDDSSNVSAMFATDSSLCTVSGDRKYMDEGYIHVEYIDKDAAVSDGDELVTSTISDKFLPGITIGTVSNLSLDMNNLTMSGDLTPVVDFKHLQTVLVIKDLKKDMLDNSGEPEDTGVDEQTPDVSVNPEGVSEE